MSTHGCSGPVSRREFLRAGVSVLGGLTLADVLRAQAATNATPPDTSVILFWMWGGPSHMETWDMKPDAPNEYRGPFKPMHTNVPGLDICEIFPMHAKLGDKFSVIRSLHHTMSSHNDGSIEVLTGKTPNVPDLTSQARSEHPDFGMVTAKLRGPRGDGLPQYVGVPHQPFMTKPNYLGLSHKAYDAGNPSLPNYKAPNLSIAGGLNATQLENRRGILRQFDRLRSDLDQRGVFDGMDRFQSTALHMLTSSATAKAFDIHQEDPRTRDRYGRHLWGQSCLLARRLAEAGTSVITIDALAPDLSRKNYFSWDDHASAELDWDLKKGMILRAIYMDQAMSALIEDIYARGLDRKVLVLALGEFGRTPRLTATKAGHIGRDHWPDAQAAMISGGGLKMGQAVGATNSKGEYPKERPLSPKDLLATVYRHLGIDYRREFKDFGGRPIPILGEGEPIRELV